MSTLRASRSPKIHRLIPSRETSPQRHAIRPEELLANKKELTPKIVIFMCGLPARGKSYVSKKMKRYLNWIGFNTEVFNVGHRRRKSQTPQELHTAILKLSMSSSDDANNNSINNKTSHPHNFFDPNNEEASHRRDRWALDVLGEVLDWFRKGGDIAIHDATNSTIARREMLSEYVNSHTPDMNVQTIFIENICTDPDILNTNIRMKTLSPDYKHMDPEEAIKDFMIRLENYEKAYESIGDHDEAKGNSYIKLINVGKKIIAHKVQGYVQSQLLMYLTNIHIKPREIWLTTHGDSVEDGDDRILSETGRLYSAALSQFLLTKYKDNSSLQIWTSLLTRSIQMAEYFSEDFQYRHTAALDELYKGEFEQVLSDMTSASVFIERIRPLIIEVERVPVSVLVIGRDLFLAALCAYLFDVPARVAFQIKFPLHSVICLRPGPYETNIQLFEFDSVNETFKEIHGSWDMLLETK